MAWGGQGSTWKWRKKRVRVLDRDGYRCQLRLDGCTTIATSVHHKTAWHGKPEDVPDHLLEAACDSCNHKAGDPSKHDPPPRGGTRW